jgi:hypothetical protein
MSRILLDQLLRFWPITVAIYLACSVAFGLSFFSWFDFRYLFALSVNELSFLFGYSILIFSIFGFLAWLVLPFHQAGGRRRLVVVRHYFRALAVPLLLIASVLSTFPATNGVHFFVKAQHGPLGFRMRNELFGSATAFVGEFLFLLATLGIFLLMSKHKSRRLVMHIGRRAIAIASLFVLMEFFSLSGTITAYLIYSKGRIVKVAVQDDKENLRGKLFLYTSKGILLAVNRVNLTLMPYDQVQWVSYPVSK